MTTEVTVCVAIAAVEEVSAAASPGTQLDRLGPVSVFAATPAGNNIGAMLLFPTDSEVGDVIEVYDLATTNPTQNYINVYPASGEAFLGSSTGDPFTVHAVTGNVFRKLTSTLWGVK
jgi:hypothetical protein